jgi:hypothetical protein
VQLEQFLSRVAGDEDHVDGLLALQVPIFGIAPGSFGAAEAACAGGVFVDVRGCSAC